MQRLGLAFWGGMPIADAVECVVAGDERGYESAWVIESYVSQFAFLGACAARTERIKLGTGAATVFRQSPTLLAASVATVDDISGGRMLLGLGVGHPEIVSERDSEETVKVTRGPTRLREMSGAVMEMLAASHEGRHASYAGEIYNIADYEPWMRASRPSVPLYIASLGPKATRLAGEIADGIVPVFMSTEGIAEAKRLVVDGAEAAGRDPGAIDISCYVPCCFHEDVEHAREAIRNVLTFHICTYDFYRRHFTRMGIGETVEAMHEATQGGASLAEAAKLLGDGDVARFGVFGTVETIAAGLERYRAAGLDLPILYGMHPGFTTYIQTVDAKPGLMRMIDGLAELVER